METESRICGICFLPYNTKDHSPRVLISCGHTLCSSCLLQILKSRKLRKCPFDNSPLRKTYKSLHHFPVNFALLTLLERKNQNQNVCQTHGEELTIFCFQEKRKICSNCAEFGEHKGHNFRNIKELKEKGATLKKDLEENLMKFQKNQLEKCKDAEALKIGLCQIGSKFEEFIRILRAKELECKNQVETLLKKMLDSQDGSLLKIEAEKVHEEINKACEKEENLVVLNRDYNGIISRLQDDKNELSKLSEKTSKMMHCIGSLLTDQAKPIKDFELLEERRKSESLEIKQKPVLFNSLFAFVIHKDLLSISVKNSNASIQTIQLEEFNKMRKIKVKLERYESLFQENSTDLISLSEVFCQLENYNSLTVGFLPSGLTDDRALYLFNIIFCRIYQLTEIEICLEGCKITNEPIRFFCTDILPKAIYLTRLTLRLGSTFINDKVLFALAESLSFLSLEAFSLEAENTKITDNGIEKIFFAICEAKELDLNLKGTFITDQSLKMLENNMKMLEERSKKG